MPLDRIKLHPRERLELQDFVDLQDFIYQAVLRTLQSILSPKDVSLQGKGRILHQWTLSSASAGNLTIGKGLGITYNDTLLGYYPAELTISFSGYTFNNVNPSNLLVWVKQVEGGIDTDPAVRVVWSGTEPITQTLNTHTRFGWTAVLQSDTTPSPQASWLEIGSIGINTINYEVTAIRPRQPDYFPSGDKNSLSDFAYYHQSTSPIDHPNGSVTTEKIASDAITTDKISNDAVTTPKIAEKAITTSKIDDYAVTDTKHGPLSVKEFAISDGAVSTPKIADGAVTEVKMASNAVTTSKIQDGTITTSKVVDRNITGVKLSNPLDYDGVMQLTRQIFLRGVASGLNDRTFDFFNAGGYSALFSNIDAKDGLASCRLRNTAYPGLVIMFLPFGVASAIRVMVSAVPQGTTGTFNVVDTAYRIADFHLPDAGYARKGLRIYGSLQVDGIIYQNNTMFVSGNVGGKEGVYVNPTSAKMFQTIQVNPAGKSLKLRRARFCLNYYLRMYVGVIGNHWISSTNKGDVEVNRVLHTGEETTLYVGVYNPLNEVTYAMPQDGWTVDLCIE